MQSTVEALEGNKVKLTVSVEAAELDRAVDAAAKKLSREVRMKGFRPGKVPRRVLEAHMGRGAIRQEALRESLPDYYAEAVREHDVDVIAAPEIDITEGEEEGDLRFAAVVEVRPSVSIPGYAGLQVTVDRPGATDEDVSRRVDRLRLNDATLEEVSRPAKTGDVLTIDRTLTIEDQEPNVVTDYAYEVGSGELGEVFDARLDGARVGDILEFDIPIPNTEDQNAGCKVLVKAVKETRLPDLTDEWVSEQTDFTTVADLEADARRQIDLVKRFQVAMQLQDKALEALTELVADDAPEALIDAEVERRIHALEHRLEAQGATFARYLSATGQSPEELVEELRAASVPTVKADLALRALADAEEIEVLEEEVDNEIARMAEQTGRSPKQIRDTLVTSDQISAVRSDIRKSKALAWLMEHVDVVDPEGQPIDRAELEPTPSDEDPPDAPPPATGTD